MITGGLAALALETWAPSLLYLAVCTWLIVAGFRHRRLDEADD